MSVTDTKIKWGDASAFYKDEDNDNKNDFDDFVVLNGGTCSGATTCNPDEDKQVIYDESKALHLQTTPTDAYTGPVFVQLKAPDATKLTNDQAYKDKYKAFATSVDDFFQKYLTTEQDKDAAKKAFATYKKISGNEKKTFKDFLIEKLGTKGGQIAVIEANLTIANGPIPASSEPSAAAPPPIVEPASEPATPPSEAPQPPSEATNVEQGVAGAVQANQKDPVWPSDPSEQVDAMNEEIGSLVEEFTNAEITIEGDNPLVILSHLTANVNDILTSLPGLKQKELDAQARAIPILSQYLSAPLDMYAAAGLSALLALLVGRHLAINARADAQIRGMGDSVPPQRPTRTEAADRRRDSRQGDRVVVRNGSNPVARDAGTAQQATDRAQDLANDYLGNLFGRSRWNPMRLWISGVGRRAFRQLERRIRMAINHHTDAINAAVRKIKKAQAKAIGGDVKAIPKVAAALKSLQSHVDALAPLLSHGPQQNTPQLVKARKAMTGARTALQGLKDAAIPANAAPNVLALKASAQTLGENIGKVLDTKQATPATGNAAGATGAAVPVPPVIKQTVGGGTKTIYQVSTLTDVGREALTRAGANLDVVPDIASVAVYKNAAGEITDFVYLDAAGAQLSSKSTAAGAANIYLPAEIPAAPLPLPPPADADTVSKNPIFKEVCDIPIDTTVLIAEMAKGNQSLERALHALVNGATTVGEILDIIDNLSKKKAGDKGKISQAVDNIGGGPATANTMETALRSAIESGVVTEQNLPSLLVDLLIDQVRSDGNAIVLPNQVALIRMKGRVDREQGRIFNGPAQPTPPPADKGKAPLGVPPPPPAPDPARLAPPLPPPPAPRETGPKLPSENPIFAHVKDLIIDHNEFVRALGKFAMSRKTGNNEVLVISSWYRDGYSTCKTMGDFINHVQATALENALASGVLTDVSTPHQIIIVLISHEIRLIRDGDHKTKASRKFNPDYVRDVVLGVEINDKVFKPAEAVTQDADAIRIARPVDEALRRANIDDGLPPETPAPERARILAERAAQAAAGPPGPPATPPRPAGKLPVPQAAPGASPLPVATAIPAARRAPPPRGLARRPVIEDMEALMARAAQFMGHVQALAAQVVKGVEEQYQQAVAQEVSRLMVQAAAARGESYLPSEVPATILEQAKRNVAASVGAPVEAVSQVSQNPLKDLLEKYSDLSPYELLKRLRIESVAYPELRAQLRVVGEKVAIQLRLNPQLRAYTDAIFVESLNRMAQAPEIASNMDEVASRYVRDVARQKLEERKAEQARAAETTRALRERRVEAEKGRAREVFEKGRHK